MILGYVLTLSVYASTFGHYLSAVFELGPWFDRSAAGAVLLLLIGVKLLGVGEASWLEIVTVWGKLAVLGVLGVLAIEPCCSSARSGCSSRSSAAPFF